MKTLVVYSDIPRSHLADAVPWMLGVPAMLSKQGVKDVKFKTAYCCTPEGKIIAEFEGPDKEAVKKALEKIEMPITAIMEATKV